jgi:hypothetical protein
MSVFVNNAAPCFGHATGAFDIFVARGPLIHPYNLEGMLEGIGILLKSGLGYPHPPYCPIILKTIQRCERWVCRSTGTERGESVPGSRSNQILSRRRSTLDGWLKFGSGCVVCHSNLCLLPDFQSV